MGLTALYKRSVATATQRSPLSKGRRHSKPRNGDLEFSEELTMTALLYRGHSYEAPAASPKACIELTWPRALQHLSRRSRSQCSSSLTYEALHTPSDPGLIRRSQAPAPSAGGFFFTYESAPTAQKEMGWTPKLANPSGETSLEEAPHEQGQVRLPVLPALLLRNAAVFHVNSDFARVINAHAQPKNIMCH